MINYIENNYVPYKEIEVNNLVCPLSGQTEPMKLVLYQLEVKQNLGTSYKKKPTGTYHQIATGETISAAKWTPEMEAFFEKSKRENPVSKVKFLKLNWMGKIFLGVGVLSISWLIISIGMVLLEKQEKQAGAKIFYEMPKVGDEYHIGIPVTKYNNEGVATASGFESSWAEVTKVSPDSICELRFVIKIPKLSKIDENILNQKIGEDTYRVKWKPKKEESQIFFALPKGSGFTSSYIGEIERVKR